MEGNVIKVGMENSLNVFVGTKGNIGLDGEQLIKNGECIVKAEKDEVGADVTFNIFWKDDPVGVPVRFSPGESEGYQNVEKIVVTAGKIKLMR